MDNEARIADNYCMYPTPEEEIRSYKKISRKLRRENNTPEKARALLLRYGILENHKKSPHGVRLAKRFR